MLIPVRCFTCGTVVGAKYEDYQNRIAEGEKPRTALDAIGLKKLCCRRMIVSQVNLIDTIMIYG